MEPSNFKGKLIGDTIIGGSKQLGW